MKETEVKEVNRENAVTIKATTFKLELGKDNGKGELVICCGNFVDGDTVKVEAEVIVPFVQAMKLANNIASASAFYQVKTGRNIGVPEKNCKQMRKLMEEAGML